MNKKTLLLIVCSAVVLLAVMILFAASQGASEDPGNTEQLPEQTLATTEQSKETNPVEVFVAGGFTATASQFYQQFCGTLPEGYFLAETLEESPDNGLQLRVLDAAKADTGMAVSMDTQDPDGKFSSLMLVAEENCDNGDFAVLLDWYITTFLTGMDEGQRTAICAEFQNHFANRTVDSKVYATDVQTAVMARLDLEESCRYYVIIVVH